SQHQPQGLLSDEILLASGSHMFGDEILSASSLYTFNNMLNNEVLLASILDNGDEILPAFDSHILGNEILSTSGSHVLSDEKLSDSENTLNNNNAFDINKQQNVEFNDQKKLEIVSGLKFQTWDQLDHYIKIYAKQNSFVSIIVGSEADDNTHRRCQYACEHQGIGCLKKIAIVKNQKQSQTKWLGCKWLVNATCPKNIEEIKITSCYLEYTNHEIHPNTIVFVSYYQQFPDEVKENIKYYTSKSFKQQNKIINKASTLLETLFNNKAQDPNWVVHWKLEPISNSLKLLFWMEPSQLLESTGCQPHILITDSDIANEVTIENIMPEIYRINCIYHISQNLIKNLKSKLGSDWDKFIKSWYKMCNSPSKQDFEFTAGVQSTQHVEGINRIIKSNITNRTSLSKLASVLDSQLARKSMYIHYSNWSQAYAKPIYIPALAQLLPKVDKWLSEFLTPPILSLQRVKIAEALYLDDFPATKIDEVITNLSTLYIQEVWETTRHRALYKNFVIILKNILESQPSITYKNSSTILTSNFVSNSTLIYPSSSISFNASRILNTRHAYGITNGLSNSVNFNQHLVTNTALNEVQDNESSDSNNEQKNSIPFDVSKVQDLVVKRKKEAPKVKCIKSSHETTNIRKEKAACLCSHYKQPNHYAKT
ncbi:9927_t:CDS:2, partial [Gigaspora margarita]